MISVKFRSLPTHSIKMNVMATSAYSFFFRSQKKFCPNTFLTVIFMYPQNIYIHPTPVGSAKNTCYNTTISIIFNNI